MTHRQCRRRGGGGQQGQFAPGPQCEGAPNDAELFQMRSSSSPSRFISLYCWFQVSLLFGFALTLLTQTSNIAHFILRETTAQPVTRAPYVVLFDLKPLNEDGNWQVCMYCMYVRKGASEAPWTHFRACKIVKFPGGVSPDPPHTIYNMGPTLCICPGPPQFSRWPCAWEG